MIVGNNVTPDTRVKRIAASCAAAGLQVTVLGVQQQGDPAEARIGNVTVLRVGVRDRYRRLATDLSPRNKRRQAGRLRSREHLQRSLANSITRLDLINQEHGRIVARIKANYRNRTHRISGVESLAAPSSDWVKGEQLLTLARRKAVRWSFRTRLSIARRKMTCIRLLFRAHRSWIAARLKCLRSPVTMDRLREDRLSRYSRSRKREVRWRRILLSVHDFDAAFSPLIHQLQPDAIHAHDMHMLGIAVRAAGRLKEAGSDTRVIYDAHEYVRGLDTHMPRYLYRANLAHESEYIQSADLVITVSDELARRLQRDYALPVRPTVVLNAPLRSSVSDDSVMQLRSLLNLDSTIPLLVYSGRVHPSRGVKLIVDALPELPGVHCVLVANTNYARNLKTEADEAGVGDRLHVVPYVQPEKVIQFLSGCTAGINFLQPCGNHEVALPNKLFEYLHAGVPLLNADVGVSSSLVRDLDIGEVFQPNDAQSFVRAAMRLIDRGEALRDRIVNDCDLMEHYSWPRQHGVLVNAYSDLLGVDLQLAENVELNIAEMNLQEERPLASNRFDL